MSTQSPPFPGALSSNSNQNRLSSMAVNITQDIKSQTQPGLNNPTLTSQYLVSPKTGGGLRSQYQVGPATPGLPQAPGGLSSPYGQNLGSLQNQTSRPLLGPQQLATRVISGGPSNLPGTQTYIQGAQGNFLGAQTYIPGQTANLLGPQTYLQGAHMQGAIPGAVAGVIPQKPASSSRIQYIPYDKTYTDYQIKQVYSSMWVPIQKKCLNYYAVEHITEYVPREVDDVRYEVVPEQQINYRVQYTPIQKQIVHLPQYANAQYGYAANQYADYGYANYGAAYPAGYQYGVYNQFSNPYQGTSPYGINIPGYQPLANRVVGSLPKTNFVTTDGYVPTYLLPSYNPNTGYVPFLPKMPDNPQLDALIGGAIKNQKNKNTDFRGNSFDSVVSGAIKNQKLKNSIERDVRGNNYQRENDYGREGGAADRQIQGSIFGFLKGGNRYG